MTTLALLPPPLKRLFERIDVAASHPELEAALERWAQRRGDRLFPQAGDLQLAELGEVTAHLFILSQRDAPSRDWEVVSIGDGASAIVMPQGDWPTLDRLGNRRVTVHIRRLLDLIRETGEPVTASFSVRAGRQPAHFQLLMAPLSSDGQRVDGALGGIVRD
jgi:hypothetical protein